MSTPGSFLLSGNEFANLARDQFHTIAEPSLRGAMLEGGHFELSVTATLNRVRTIEASSNLVNRTILTTVTGQGGKPGQLHRHRCARP